MHMHPSRTALVTGGTKNDVDAMAVLVLNIKKTNPHLADEIVIFHDGITAKDQSAIQKIFPVRFIRYHCPVSRLRLLRNKTIRYFSPMVFCKFECFKLLSDYDTVIWTDYDILIQGDISGILTGTNSFAVICNKETSLQKMFYSSIRKKNMDEYDLDGHSVTTPLFVLHKSIGDYITYYHWCYNTLSEYSKYLYLPEQCIFTMLVQKYNIAYDEIDMKRYCTHPSQADDSVLILHAYGQPKFWNGLKHAEWEKYFQEWISFKKG